MRAFPYWWHHHPLPAHFWRVLWPLALAPIALTMLSACAQPEDQDTENILYSVAAVSATDIWAVGMISSPTLFSKILIEHWNGKQWQTIPPSLGGTLFGVAAITANDAWVVGSTARGPTTRGSTESAIGGKVLVMHWDGTRWSQATSPGLGSRPDSALSAVAAVSSHDVWAVGQQQSMPAILHWDGQQWSAVSPAPPPELNVGALSAVHALSSTNVWAAGWYSGFSSSEKYPLVEHWDGRNWHFVPTPDYAQDHRILGNATFAGLTALASGNLWATGEMKGGSGTSVSLVEHWMGSHWYVVDTPAPAQVGYSYPQAILAMNAHNLWVIGYWYSPKTAQNYPLLVHWDGQSWRNAAPFPLQSAPGVFFAGTALTAKDLWVVGSRGGAFDPAPTLGTIRSQTLIEHWDGTHWSVVPSPNPGQPVPVPQE